MSEGHEPGWYPDPTGRHEMRWHGGASWMDTVRDGDAQSEDPIDGTSPGTALVPVDPPPEAPPRDPNVLWEGRGSSMTGAVASYMVSRTGITYDKGRFSSRSQQTHISLVADIQISQTVTQKSRGVGTVTVRLTDGGVIALADIKETREARDAINQARTDYAQAHWERQQQERTAAAGGINITNGGSAPAAGSTPVVNIAHQIRELAELRDLGILTEDEFATQKAKLLD